MSDEAKAYITTDAPEVTNYAAATNNGITDVTLSQNALGIASAVQLQFVTKIANSDYAASDLYAVVSWSHKGEPQTQRIEGADFEKKGNFYVVVFEGLCAYEGRELVEVTVYNSSDVAVSETWTYSIESYVAYRQGITTPEATMNTLNALMNYYDAAQEQFNPTESKWIQVVRGESDASGWTGLIP